MTRSSFPTTPIVFFLMMMVVVTSVTGAPFGKQSSRLLATTMGTIENTKKTKAPTLFSSTLSSSSSFDINNNVFFSIHRGGSAVLDPKAVGKVAAVMAFVQGVLNKLCPDKMMELYGFKSEELKEDPLMKLVISRLGAVFSSVGVMGYVLLQESSSLSAEDTLKKAVGIVEAIFAAELFAGLINDEPTKGNFDSKPQLVMLTLASIVAYGCLSNASWSINAIKILCVGIFGIASMLNAFLPNMTVERVYGGKRTDIPEEFYFLLKGFGYWCLGVITMIVLLLQNIEGSSTIGLPQLFLLGWIPIYIFNVDAMLISQKIDKLGLDKMKWMGWLLLQTVLMGSLVFFSK